LWAEKNCFEIGGGGQPNKSCPLHYNEGMVTNRPRKLEKNSFLTKRGEKGIAFFREKRGRKGEAAKNCWRAVEVGKNSTPRRKKTKKKSGATGLLEEKPHIICNVLKRRIKRGKNERPSWKGDLQIAQEGVRRDCC